MNIREIKKQGFPLDSFPIIIQDFIKGFAKGSGAQYDYVAAGVLMAGSSVASDCEIAIKPDYVDKSNLFICIVGHPGVTKSAPLKAALRPILYGQSKRFATYMANLSMWKKNNVGKRNKSEPPSAPPFDIITGGTMEGFVKCLADMYIEGLNPSAIYYRDELKGFFSGMNAYRKGQGDDQERWLQLFTGDTISLKLKSETIYVEDGRASVLGSIQPSVFKECMEDHGNGMIDRFAFIVYNGQPNESNIYSYVEKYIVEKYNNFITDLGKPKKVFVVFNNKPVQEKIREFERWCFQVGREQETGSFKKWEQICFRIMLILSVLWQRDKLEVDIAKKAIAISKYLAVGWIQTREMAEETLIDQIKIALISYFNGMSSAHFMSLRDIIRVGPRIMRKNSEVTRMALSSLVEDGDFITKKRGKLNIFGLKSHV